MCMSGDCAYIWCADQANVDRVSHVPGHSQMGNLADSVSEETSLRHKYEAPLSMSILKRSTSLSSRPQAEPSNIPGGGKGNFMRSFSMSHALTPGVPRVPSVLEQGLGLVVGI